MSLKIVLSIGLTAITFTAAATNSVSSNATTATTATAISVVIRVVDGTAPHPPPLHPCLLHFHTPVTAAGEFT